MDYSRDGTENGEYTTAEIAALKNSAGGRKIVLAYLSIGEAEDYRFYWQQGWQPNNPAWLGPENPDWPGNYRVRFWYTEWQNIVFSYLDRIIGAGFDGVYLDLVDVYEYWGPDGVNENPHAKDDMVAFVRAIAQYARAQRPNFIVVAQNAPELVAEAEYLEVLDGLAVEDVFYDGDRRQDGDLTAEFTGYMDEALAHCRVVFAVDYCRKRSYVDDFYRRCLERGYVPYATVRDLDRLVVNTGHEPYPTR